MSRPTSFGNDGRTDHGNCYKWPITAGACDFIRCSGLPGWNVLSASPAANRRLVFHVRKKKTKRSRRTVHGSGTNWFRNSLAAFLFALSTWNQTENTERNLSQASVPKCNSQINEKNARVVTVKIRPIGLDWSRDHKEVKTEQICFRTPPVPGPR